MNKKQNRTPKGQSIVELLIATVLFSSVATIMLSMYSLNTKALSGFTNKGDVIRQTTVAMGNIGKLVRSARGFGDIYGVIQPQGNPLFNWSNLLSNDPNLRLLGINTQGTTGSILSGAGFSVSSVFPSPGDPYYTNGILPSAVYGGTWPWAGQTALAGDPVAVSTYANAKYILGPDTLIVQVPVFVGAPPAGGGIGLDPSSDPSGAQSPYIWPATWNGTAATPAGVMQAMDTYIFRVIPDPDPANLNQFIMQEAAFPANPGGHPTNNLLPINAPVTIMTGIVGPLDANNHLQTFSYIEKVDNGSTTIPPATGYVLTDYNGVLVQAEVMRNNTGVKGAVACFKSEYYLRNNTQIQLMGPPNQ